MDEDDALVRGPARAGVDEAILEDRMRALLDLNDAGGLGKDSQQPTVATGSGAATPSVAESPATSDYVGPGVRVDPWVLVKRIGGGGYADVYEAHHAELPASRVAIKVLREGLTGADDLARFRHEAELMSRLRGDSLVYIMGFGFVGEARPYIAMELLAGQSLAAAIKAKKLLELDRVLDVLRQSCAAVQSLHDAGVIHRDLSPGNIFLCDEPAGRVKIIDLGLAKSDQSLTATGDFMGTLRYTAPELLKHGVSAADERSDVHALAAIAYELLTGRRAFDGRHPQDVIHQVSVEKPLPASEVRPGLPKAVDRVLAGALSKAPHKRPASVRTLWERLRSALEAPEEIDVRAPVADHVVSDLRARGKTRRRLAPLLGVGIAAAIGVGIWQETSNDDLNDAVGFWRMAVVCDDEAHCRESGGWLHLAADGSGQQCNGNGTPNHQPSRWDDTGYHWGGYTHQISFKRGTLRLTEDNSGRETTLVRLDRSETPEGCGWDGTAEYEPDVAVPRKEGRQPFAMTESRLGECRRWMEAPGGYKPGWHCRATVGWEGTEFVSVDGTVYWEDPHSWCRCVLDEPKLACPGNDEGVVVHYSFNEGSANDVSGNCNHASVVGTLDPVPGEHDGAVAFDNLGDTEVVATDYALLPNLGNIGGSYTVAIKFATDDIVSGCTDDELCAERLGGRLAGNQDVVIDYYSQAHDRADLALLGAGPSGSHPSAKVTDGRWHWVVAVSEQGGQAAMYVDGKEIDSWPAARKPANFVQFAIGANGAFTGFNARKTKVDEFYLYDRALEPAEVAALP